jgi:hypothetical protein
MDVFRQSTSGIKAHAKIDVGSRGVSLLVIRACFTMYSYFKFDIDPRFHRPLPVKSIMDLHRSHISISRNYAVSRPIKPAFNDLHRLHTGTVQVSHHDRTRLTPHPMGRQGAGC